MYNNFSIGMVKIENQSKSEVFLPNPFLPTGLRLQCYL